MSNNDNRVLIADDDPIDAEMLKKALALVGIKAVTVRCGEEAVTMFNQAFNSSTPFKVVITDLMMPWRFDLNGDEVTFKDDREEPAGVVVARELYSKNVPVYVYTSAETEAIKGYITHDRLFKNFIFKQANKLEESVLQVLAEIGQLSGIQTAIRRNESGRDDINRRFVARLKYLLDDKEADNWIGSYAQVNDLEIYQLYEKLKKAFDLIDDVERHIIRRYEMKRMKLMLKEAFICAEDLGLTTKNFEEPRLKTKKSRKG